MKELNSLSLNSIVGGTCYTTPGFWIVDQLTGVCIGIKVR
jgi:hypothetical protein